MKCTNTVIQLLHTSNISKAMVLMNCFSSGSLPGRLLAILAKVVRRKTASEVKVFSNMSANLA